MASPKITVGAIPVAGRTTSSCTTSSLAGLHDGITNVSATVAHAIEDRLADGLAGRALKTTSTQREVLEPLIDIIGAARDPLARRTAHKGRREKPAPSLCRQPAG